MALFQADSSVKLVSGSKPNGSATTFTAINAGPVAGFITIEQMINPISLVAIATNDIVPYRASVDSLFEEGYGVVDKSAHTLTRTFITANSSRSQAKIDFSGASANPTIVVPVLSVVAQSMHTMLQGEPGARITGTQGAPVTAADVTAITTIALEPFNAGWLPMFWDTGGTLPYALPIQASTITKALGTLASGVFPVDCFVDNSTPGTIAVTLVPWTSATVRATALVRKGKFLYKTGDYRFICVGTIRPKTTTTTEDSDLWRGIINLICPVDRRLFFTASGAPHHSYSGALRQYGGSAASQVDFLIADPAAAKLLPFKWSGYSLSAASGSVTLNAVMDSTSAAADAAQGISPVAISGSVTGGGYGSSGDYRPGLGNHYIALTESTSGGSADFYAAFLSGIVQG